MRNATPGEQAITALQQLNEEFIPDGEFIPDRERVGEKIRGRVVMVTGAAGSVGSQLCLEIAVHEPLAIVGFDQAETALIELDEEMRQKFPGIAFHAEMGSITSAENVNRVMGEYEPAIVCHAAGLKHVPQMESHLFAALESNVFGTWTVGQAAVHFGVETFVLISTDKAVRPASVMGASKRIAELAIRLLDRSSDTKFIAVRFGNVFGSSGSVVPIFKKQISEGGPVTVTDPAMERFFMTAAEASRLVLEACALGHGGETFVLEMGEPIKIIELARSLIREAGFEPDREIEIRIIGMRPGEKLSEELSMPADRLAATPDSRVGSVVCSESFDPFRIEDCLRELHDATMLRDVPQTIILMKELVPYYEPSSLIVKQMDACRGRRTGHLQQEEPIGANLYE